MIALPDLLSIATTLGIGLMVGLERERRKGDGPARQPAGLRTCIITALLGQLAWELGGSVLLGLLLIALSALMVAAYVRDRSEDPGLTTEVALLLLACLGALAASSPAAAAALAVVLTILLALRGLLHDLARRWLSPREVRDGLVLATAALVVLPLMPDRPLGPSGLFNPHLTWSFTVLLMAISAAGHLAARMAGSGHGLALSGFIGGFVSSTATIASLGAQARRQPENAGAATLGAILSTVATVIQMTLLLWAIDPGTARAMLPSLASGGLAAVGYALLFYRRGGQPALAVSSAPGAMFDLRLVLMLAGTVTLLSVLSALLLQLLGAQGLLLGSLLAGLADAHAPAAAITGLVRDGLLPPAQAVPPLLAALSGNTLAKAAMAWSSGGRAYCARLLPGLLLVLAALWLGYLGTG